MNSTFKGRSEQVPAPRIVEQQSSREESPPSGDRSCCRRSEADESGASAQEGAEVILFGSRARGDARVDSDWDILILIDGARATCADFEKFAYPFVDYGWSVGEQINPLIYSFEDWSKRSITPFYKNVQLEGVSLCR